MIKKIFEFITKKEVCPVPTEQNSFTHLQYIGFDIPEEYTFYFCSILDKYEANKSNLNHFILWNYIEQIIPEVKEKGNLDWKIKRKTVTTYQVYYILPVIIYSSGKKM